MIRILFFVAVILALGLGFAWLADRPGEMILVWQGQRVEMSLIAGIAGFVIALAAVVLLLWLIRAVFSSPDRMQRYFRTRRRDRGSCLGGVPLTFSRQPSASRTRVIQSSSTGCRPKFRPARWRGGREHASPTHQRRLVSSIRAQGG